MIAAIEAALQHDVAGDPITGIRWTRRTTEKIATELATLDIQVCPRTVARILKDLDYRLRVNHKRVSAGSGPDRDQQFQYIAEQHAQFAQRGLPIVSIDTKKRELIGNFKNQGTTWERSPQAVNDHDFRSQADGIAIPYGVYDLCANRGFVVVGTSHDTPEFAADNLVRWWQREGLERYRDASELLVLADSGGSNAPRIRCFKYALQTRLADPHHLKVTVCHSEVIEQYGDANDWRNLVGTGPFMLTDWVEGSSVTWDKNPDYWGYDEKYPQNRLPYVDQIRDLTMPEVATRLAALRTGKLDSLYKGTAIQSVDAAESLERTNPEIELWTKVGASVFSTGLNVNKPPFNDIRVRKAMQMALDLETVNSVFFKGYGDPTPHGQVGDAVPGYFIPFEEWPAELKKVYDYDPEGAEALLDAAGYPRGADGIRFKTELMHNVHKDLNYYELVASYWNKIGIDVEIDFPPIATWVSRRTSRDFEMIEHEMAYGSLSDPLNPVNRFTNVPWNSAAVEDPVYDAMFEAAGAATDIDELQRLVKELDMYAIERHWVVWSPMNPTFDAFWPWVKGYNGEFTLGYMQKHFLLARVWIDQELKEAMGY